MLLIIQKMDKKMVASNTKNQIAPIGKSKLRWHLKVHILSGSSCASSLPRDGSMVKILRRACFHTGEVRRWNMCVFVWVEFTPQNHWLFWRFGIHLDLLVSSSITDKLTLVTSYDRLSPGTQGQKAFTLQNCGEPCRRPGALAKPTERDTIFGQNFAACRA